MIQFLISAGRSHVFLVLLEQNRITVFLKQVREGEV